VGSPLCPLPDLPLEIDCRPDPGCLEGPTGIGLLLDLPDFPGVRLPDLCLLLEARGVALHLRPRADPEREVPVEREVCGRRGGLRLRGSPSSEAEDPEELPEEPPSKSTSHAAQSVSSLLMRCRGSGGSTGFPDGENSMT